MNSAVRTAASVPLQSRFADRQPETLVEPVTCWHRGPRLIHAAERRLLFWFHTQQTLIPCCLCRFWVTCSPHQTFCCYSTVFWFPSFVITSWITSCASSSRVPQSPPWQRFLPILAFWWANIEVHLQWQHLMWMLQEEPQTSGSPVACGQKAGCVFAGTSGNKRSKMISGAWLILRVSSKWSAI